MRDTVYSFGLGNAARGRVSAKRFHVVADRCRVIVPPFSRGDLKAFGRGQLTGHAVRTIRLPLEVERLTECLGEPNGQLEGVVWIVDGQFDGCHGQFQKRHEMQAIVHGRDATRDKTETKGAAGSAVGSFLRKCRERDRQAKLRNVPKEREDDP